MCLVGTVPQRFEGFDSLSAMMCIALTYCVMSSGLMPETELASD